MRVSFSTVGERAMDTRDSLLDHDVQTGFDVLAILLDDKHALVCKEKVHEFKAIQFFVKSIIFTLLLHFVRQFRSEFKDFEHLPE